MSGCYVVLITLLFVAMPAAGQGTAHVGVQLGIGSIPRSLFHGCWANDIAGSARAVELGASASVTRGRFSLHTITAAHGDATFQDCKQEPLHLPDGVHITPLAIVGSDFTTTDLRLAYRPFEEHVFVMIGGGRMWSHGVPFLLTELQLRSRGLVSVLLAAELATYRTPLDVVTWEWKDNDLVRVLSRERTHDWRSSFTLRLGGDVRVLRW